MSSKTAAKKARLSPLPRVKGQPLPHEREQAPHSTAAAPNPVMQQAHRDLEAGLVDTDMRATPGLDAQRRTKLVPGAGGRSTGRT